LLVDTVEGTYAFTHARWNSEYQPAQDPLAEDAHALSLSHSLITANSDLAIPGHGDLARHDKAESTDVFAEVHDTVLNAVKKANNAWIAAFNSSDVKAATDAYKENSLMTVKPFGRFVGKATIEAFWVNIIAQRLKDVKYIAPEVQIISDKAALISSKWSTNKAHGMITKDLSALQKDGSAKLRIDNFEVQTKLCGVPLTYKLDRREFLSA
jgi:ketosteroid isomerase-like protein